MLYGASDGSESTPSLNLPLIALLPKLKPHFGLAILSNSERSILEGRLGQKYLPYFDVIIVSGDLTFAKPHPAIFRVTAAALKVSPQYCLLMDDNERHCRSAASIGMLSYLFVGTQSAVSFLEYLLDSVKA